MLVYCKTVHQTTVKSAYNKSAYKERPVYKELIFIPQSLARN